MSRSSGLQPMPLEMPTPVTSSVRVRSASSRYSVPGAGRLVGGHGAGEQRPARSQAPSLSLFPGRSASTGGQQRGLAGAGVEGQEPVAGRDHQAAGGPREHGTDRLPHVPAGVQAVDVQPVDPAGRPVDPVQRAGRGVPARSLAQLQGGHGQLRRGAARRRRAASW